MPHPDRDRMGAPCKAVLIGVQGVGKSALFERLVHAVECPAAPPAEPVAPSPPATIRPVARELDLVATTSAPRLHLQLVDAPPLRYAKNLLAAMTTADVAVLVTSPAAACAPAAAAAAAQAELDSLLHLVLGMGLALVVAVSHCDAASAAQPADDPGGGLAAARAAVTARMRALGVPAADNVPIIPTSAATGGNLAALLHALAAAPRRASPDAHATLPLRCVLHSVELLADLGLLVDGRLMQGRLETGEHLRFLPAPADGPVVGTVKSIETRASCTHAATAGDCVRLWITGVPSSALVRGMVGCDASHTPATETSALAAPAVVTVIEAELLGLNEGLRVGAEYHVHAGSGASGLAAVLELAAGSVLGGGSGPRGNTLRDGARARVRLALSSPLAVDTTATSPNGACSWLLVRVGTRLVARGHITPASYA